MVESFSIRQYTVPLENKSNRKSVDGEAKGGAGYFDPNASPKFSSDDGVS